MWPVVAAHHRDNVRASDRQDRGVDSAEDMLPRGEFDTDILCRIAIVFAHLRQDGLHVLYTGVEEGINLETFAYLFF